MFRFFGVLLIFAACCFLGMYMSAAMKKKLERLGLYRRMTEEISTLIRYRSLTVREIIAGLKSGGSYKELEFLQNRDYSDKSRPAGEIWLESVISDNTLSDEEKRLLSELGTKLGTTDTEGQLSVIAVFGEELDAMIKKQNEMYRVKGRLCRSMGILVGAMFGIMII